MTINNSVYFQSISIDGSIDFVVTFDAEQREYIADIFEAGIVQSEDAYIDTFTFQTLNEAIEDLKLYQLNVR